MVQNPPAGSQRIVPYLNYADPKAAIEFLRRAFGFEQGLIFEAPDGSVGHCELQLGGETFMLSSEFAEGGLSSPKALGGVHASVLVYVDDVDAHYEQAKAAGAQIVQEPGRTVLRRSHLPRARHGGRRLGLPSECAGRVAGRDGRRSRGDGRGTGLRS